MTYGQENQNAENSAPYQGCLEAWAVSGSEAQAQNGSDRLDLEEADEELTPAMLEAGGRSIAATKRGLPTDDPAVDKVWTSYVGHARKAYLAMRKAQA